jgi:predicted ATPase/DNA-binding CsgD family transcriptional regulator
MGQIESKSQKPIISVIPTSFIGRQHELIEVTRFLTTSRLVTLIGTAGCGKTRLALRAAQEINGRYPDGIHWLELAPLTDATLLPQTIAKGLHLKEQAERPLLQTIIDALKERNSRLILDNCEHLRTACAELITTLLAETSISILTTSREPLRVIGEKLYPVPPLSLPPRPLSLDAVADISQFDAIQLFTERAGAILPQFALTADNVDIVANICHQLDGLPLAIEMAAARVNVLTVTQIANRLDNHFALLAPSAHINSPHQTLREAIDWSYDLLTGSEQLLLQRLSVFAGGCSLSEAETVCAGEGIEREQVLDLLASLVNKSLVTAVTLQRSQARYILLETIRQYGQEKLKEANEWSHIHDRHLQCFLQLAEETEPKLRDEYQKLWLNWLEDEYDNIRAALGWSIKNSQIEQGLRIIIALYQFWMIRDHVEEGLIWLERLLTQANDRITAVVHTNALFYAMTMAGFRGNSQAQMVYGSQAVALAGAMDSTDKEARRWLLAARAYQARIAGDHQTAFVYARQLIHIARELGDTYQLALSLSLWSFAAMSLGEYDEARSMLDEALPLLRGMRNPYRLAMALNFSGDLARCQQSYRQAQTAYEESIPLLRKIDAVRDLASALHNLGHACLHLRDVDRAATLSQESMALHQEQGNEAGMTECLLGFSALAIIGQLPKVGVRLLAAAANIGGQRFITEWAATRMTYNHYLDHARATVSEAAFQLEQVAGQSLSLAQAVVLAEEVVQQTAVAQQIRQQLDQLTLREREVAVLIAQGKSNDEIAAELMVSKRTAEKHIAHIRSKLGFTERTQIVHWIFESGLMDDRD